MRTNGSFGLFELRDFFNETTNMYYYNETLFFQVQKKSLPPHEPRDLILLSITHWQFHYIKSRSANRPTETLVTKVTLEEEKINMNRFWLPFSELFGNLSRKPLHHLFQLLFCPFLFKQHVVQYSSLNNWCVHHQKKKKSMRTGFGSPFLNFWNSYKKNHASSPPTNIKKHNKKNN